MSDLGKIVRELVIANRILGNEDVVDAYGHVSVRHADDPGRYLLARSLAPELVEAATSSNSRSTGRPPAKRNGRCISSASSTARSTRHGPT